MDSVAINSTALHRIAEMRRSAIRPAINPSFRAICTKEMKESGEWLFGADLAQRIKDLKETSRVGSVCYQKPKATTRGGGFLGRANTSTPRGRPVYNQRPRQHS